MHIEISCSYAKMIACAAIISIAACANSPPAASPRIERIADAALPAGVVAPAAKIGMAEIVAMTKQGESPVRIIARIDQSASISRLNASEIVEMAQSGVNLAVLDHILETERQRVFDDVAAQIAQREQACIERVDREVRQCRLQSTTPFWPQPTCWPPHAGYPYWRCF
jgi:putative N-acetylmannosamine-6-phosphate epimerase